MGKTTRSHLQAVGQGDDEAQATQVMKAHAIACWIVKSQTREIGVPVVRRSPFPASIPDHVLAQSLSSDEPCRHCATELTGPLIVQISGLLTRPLKKAF